MAASDVLVGAPVTGTGGVKYGPAGTPVPTAVDGVLDPALVNQGYVSEDGLTMTVNRETEKVKAWGGATVRIIQTDFECTFQFAFLETTEESLKRLHGDSNVDVTGQEITVLINSERLPDGVWIFDMKDGDNLVRVVVPNAQVTEVEDVTFVHTEVTSRGLTIEALPEADTGNQAYMYLRKGAAVGDPGEV